MATRHHLDTSQVAPLLTALVKEPSADARKKLLKAVVRLPLHPEGWIGVAATICYLLESGAFAFLHGGEPPSLPLEDVIAEAAFVPVRQVRDALRGILSLEHPAARKAAARALAVAGDPSGARELLRQLHESDRNERYEAAKHIYRLRDGIKPFASELNRMFDGEKEGSIKLWLALSLGVVGEPERLEILFNDVQQGKCDLVEFFINPAECELAEPIPPAIVPILERLANNHDQEPAIRDLAAHLFDLSRPANRKEEPGPPDDGDAAQSARVSRQVEIVLDEMVASSEGDAPVGDFANQLADIMNDARGRFSPDVNKLFGYYRKARAFYALRMELAWALSRAPLGAVVELVASQLGSDDAAERGEAAELLELVARYRTTVYAPYFGGGGCGGVEAGPSDVSVEPETTLDFRDYGLTARGTPPGYVGGGASWNETMAVPAVHLAAAVQQTARPGDRFVAAFAAYVQEQEKKVLEEMARRCPHSEPQLDMKACRWRLGTPVTIVAAGEYLSVDPPIEEFVWEGGRIVRSFEITVATNAPLGSTVLKFNVYIAEARVAALPVEIQINTHGVAPRETRVSTQPPRTAFASYSSADKLRVLERVSEISLSAGIDIYQDCLDLRPGEQWKPALEREIQARQLFFLFWSAHAKASAWVEWEWRTALKEKGLDAIELRPLEPVDQAPPPAELAALHFNDPIVMIREYYARQAARPPV